MALRLCEYDTVASPCGSDDVTTLGGGLIRIV
jgi:hypothetical protein